MHPSLDDKRSPKSTNPDLSNQDVYPLQARFSEFLGTGNKPGDLEIFQILNHRSGPLHAARRRPAPKNQDPLFLYRSIHVLSQQTTPRRLFLSYTTNFSMRVKEDVSHYPDLLLREFIRLFFLFFFLMWEEQRWQVYSTSRWRCILNDSRFIQIYKLIYYFKIIIWWWKENYKTSIDSE